MLHSKELDHSYRTLIKGVKCRRI